MNRIFVITVLSLCSVNSALCSAESQLGVTYTEVTVTTAISSKGFTLRTREDPESFVDYLDQIIVKWKGKDIAHLANRFPRIKYPQLTHLNILAPPGNEGIMILVIPFKYRRPQGDDHNPHVFDPKAFDAARLTFIEGKLTQCKLVEAVAGKKNMWKYSYYDFAKKKVVGECIDECDTNPYLP
ncbi:MAG: hypothetical protein AB8F34_11020 [Akkermansiaceae bacterium]